MPLSPAHRATTITSLNLKGGVGKTHLCWLLASVCIEQQKRCLIVDLDQQANITQSFLPHHRDPTGVELIFEPSSDVDPLGLVHRSAYEHIDLIPVTGHFAHYDLAQAEQWEKKKLHTALPDALAILAPHYDYILLDCPPRISLASYAALCAADFALVPLEAADWGARGTSTVRAVIERVQQRDNPQLQLLGYVVSKFKRQRAFQGAYLTQIRETFGELVFDTVIPDSAQFERSVDDAIPITIHSPSSNAARIARRLFDEVESRIAGLTKEEHAGIGRSRRQSGARPDRATLARR